MITWRTIRRLFRMVRDKPYLSLRRFGQITNRPQVSLSLNGRRGSMTIDAWTDDDQGNAQAEMLAKDINGFSHIPVLDCRNPLLPVKLAGTE